MKKLLNIIGDIFLFSLLLIVLVLPLLVSFNLDPKLKEIDIPVVAGISDSTEEGSIIPNIEENFVVDDNISILGTENRGNRYTLKFKINKLDKKDSQFSIGKLINEEKVTVNYFIKLYADKKDLLSSTVFAETENERYLFNRNEFSEAIVELDPGEEQFLGIVFRPTNPISYPIEAAIEVRARKK